MATIILTLDGSPFAEQAIPHAVGRCGSTDELLLFQVIDPAPTFMAPETFLSEIDLTQCQDYMDTMVQRLRERGLNVRGSVTVGSAREAIVKQAETEKAALVVMSSHGRSGWQRWLLGSVAERVARQAPCPVWLVRCEEPVEPREPWNEAAARVTRVMIPLDTSERADEAIEYVTASLDKASVSLILLGAANLAWLGQTDVCGEVLTEMRQQLQQRCDRLRSEGWEVEVVIDPAAAAPAILDNALTLRVDLIALTSHGRTGADRWVMGSVAERVVRHATCPVVVVRRGLED